MVAVEALKKRVSKLCDCACERASDLQLDQRMTSP